MTILSAEGEELWKVVNRPGSGGSAGERIILEEEYYGPVTIVIDNIIPGWDVASSIDDSILAGEREEIRDSVTFTARVIPEFPFFVMLPLVVGTSLMIIAMRIRSRYRFQKNVIVDIALGVPLFNECRPSDFSHVTSSLPYRIL
jgi:hypothetical protein